MENSDLSLEQAKQIMSKENSTQPAPATGEPSEVEFKPAETPASLKAAIVKLAADEFSGRVTSAEASLSLKNWSKKGGYPLEALREDFNREKKVQEDASNIVAVKEEKPELNEAQLAQSVALGKNRHRRRVSKRSTNTRVCGKPLYDPWNNAHRLRQAAER